jgi:hypothetical protein
MSSVIDTIRRLLERPAPTEPSVVVPLDDPSIDRLLHLLCDTRDDELSCEEVFARLDEYVDCLISHKRVMDSVPLVEHHLTLCADCRDELHALQLALALAAADD